MTLFGTLRTLGESRNHAGYFTKIENKIIGFRETPGSMSQIRTIRLKRNFRIPWHLLN